MIKKNVDAHVGKRLKDRRIMMGLSQEVVAKSVGITFQQVQKYEKGSNAMNSVRLYELASFMGVPVAYFFEGIDEAVSGFAEAPALAFDYENDAASDRESMEMMKSFKSIKESNVRRRLSDLMRAIIDNKAILD